MKTGDRVKLISMDNDPNPVENGTEGTIFYIGGGVVEVEWDNGRILGLVVGQDIFTIIPENGRI